MEVLKCKDSGLILRVFFCPLSKPQAAGLAWAWACALLLFISSAYAGQVTLAWDAVSSPSLSGYRLYYGPTSGSYSSHFDVSTQTTSYTYHLKNPWLKAHL